MTKEEIRIHEGFISVMNKLDNELELKNSSAERLGRHEYNELKKSLMRGKGNKWIYELIMRNRDLHGNISNPENFIQAIDKYLKVAERMEEYEVATEISIWKKKTKFYNRLNSE